MLLYAGARVCYGCCGGVDVGLCDVGWELFGFGDVLFVVLVVGDGWDVVFVCAIGDERVLCGVVVGCVVEFFVVFGLCVWEDCVLVVFGGCWVWCVGYCDVGEVYVVLFDLLEVVVVVFDCYWCVLWQFGDVLGL